VIRDGHDGGERGGGGDGASGDGCGGATEAASAADWPHAAKTKRQSAKRGADK